MTAMFEFLTPQIFNMLVIANLLVGLALIAYRFTRDMQRPLPPQQREQAHDEISSFSYDDTDSSQSAPTVDDIATQKKHSSS
jgi:hypothetical protein